MQSQAAAPECASDPAVGSSQEETAVPSTSQTAAVTNRIESFLGFSARPRIPKGVRGRFIFLTKQEKQATGYNMPLKHHHIIYQHYLS